MKYSVTNLKNAFGTAVGLVKKGYAASQPVLDKSKQLVVAGKDRLVDVYGDVESSRVDINYNHLLNYYKKSGVAGEEKLSVLQTLCAIGGINFGIVSNSGSGKTYCLDKLIDLLPDDGVYRLELSSKTAPFYDSENINKSNFVYIPELQKAMRSKSSDITEMLKNMAEGKPCKRIVTKSSGQDIQEITGDKTIFFTLANENYFNPDKEFNRRYLMLETDDSRDQTEKILDLKIQNRNGYNDSLLKPNELRALRKHIGKCIDMKVDFFNPYLEEITKKIPKTILARSYTDHLFDLFDSSALFNYKDREQKEGRIVVEKKDVSLILKLYWEDFIEKVKDK
ncbi:hypothetical protein KY321_02120 [Candidatus Woesearchaeota archaeon]|nr:hypothetical protein [Candidatus Woesearchaeota archaeon]